MHVLLPSMRHPAGPTLPSESRRSPLPPQRSPRLISIKGALPTMFHISRELYRELADDLTNERDREHVLRACEATVQRLVCDRFYFAHPARTLFTEVRWR